jgi:FKBP-type peptidyl-prolyl cis-trans isomerase
MQKEKLAAIGLVVIIIGAIVAFLVVAYGTDLFAEKKETGASESAIKAGDCVDVYYIGKFTNGTVFDTNIQDVAMQWGLYNETDKELGRYNVSLVFVDPDYQYGTPPTGYENYSLGYMPGFLKGLIGMEENQTKNVTIPPEDAYGIWNSTMFQQYLEAYGMTYYPRVSTGPISETVTRDYILQYLNMSLDVANLTVNQTFDYMTGVSQEGENVTWQIQVTNISDENITIKNLLQNGSIFKTEGAWDGVVTFVNETTYSIRSDPVIGGIYGVPGFFIKVVDLNETAIDMAFNTVAPDVKFIDQTLVFQLETVKVYKTSSLLEAQS